MPCLKSLVVISVAKMADLREMEKLVIPENSNIYIKFEAAL
jgi:hypothetical protein